MKCSLRLSAFKAGSVFFMVVLPPQLAANTLGEHAGSAATLPFFDSIFAQTGAGLPAFWGTNNGQPIPAHYSFSTNPPIDVTRKKQLLEAMQAIPTVSIVTDSTNVFSSETGIYLHPMERGKTWERPAIVNFFDTLGRKVCQSKCGLRIHGGVSRQPAESPKHSFRLAFRSQYGQAKLRAPLFGTNSPQDFDDLVLRAGSNDSWLNSNGAQRGRATYLRDEWMRRSMEAMGHRSARGIFVHLYLNGLYWGFYNLCERPGGQMLETSGENTDCDVLKGDETDSGDRVAWNKMLALARSGLEDDGRYQEISRQLDMPQFTDFVLLNLYAGNSDWDRSANWYAIRPRKPAGRFQFFVWDAECTLDNPEVNSFAAADEESPLDLFQKLLANTIFRADAAKRAQQLLFGDGPLASEASAKRFRVLIDSVARAMPLEEARWGSYRRDIHHYKTEPFELYALGTHWQPEVDRIVMDFFPKRREIFRDQLRELGVSSP